MALGKLNDDGSAEKMTGMDQWLNNNPSMSISNNNSNTGGSSSTPTGSNQFGSGHASGGSDSSDAVDSSDPLADSNYPAGVEPGEEFQTTVLGEKITLTRPEKSGSSSSDSNEVMPGTGKQDTTVDGFVSAEEQAERLREGKDPIQTVYDATQENLIKDLPQRQQKRLTGGVVDPSEQKVSVASNGAGGGSSTGKTKDKKATNSGGPEYDPASDSKKAKAKPDPKPDNLVGTDESGPGITSTPGCNAGPAPSIPTQIMPENIGGEGGLGAVETALVLAAVLGGAKVAGVI